MTPAELEAYRQQCETFDKGILAEAAKAGEPEPLTPDEEYLLARRY
jgi:hypothetical protein